MNYLCGSIWGQLFLCAPGLISFHQLKNMVQALVPSQSCITSIFLLRESLPRACQCAIVSPISEASYTCLLVSQPPSSYSPISLLPLRAEFLKRVYSLCFLFFHFPRNPLPSDSFLLHFTENALNRSSAISTLTSSVPTLTSPEASGIKCHCVASLGKRLPCFLSATSSRVVLFLVF